MTPSTITFAADLIAITILVFAVFYPRHRRRDLVTAFLGVNVGVLAVAATLATVEVGAGLGLGLFGVLSIIRLRSDEIGHQEIAYYFAALALGLIGGLGQTNPAIAVGLMALIVAVLAIVDNPRLLARSRSELIHLDAAYPDRTALVARLEQLLGARVTGVEVRKLDLVSDTTTVQVRYEIDAQRAGTADAQSASSLDVAASR